MNSLQYCKKKETVKKTVYNVVNSFRILISDLRLTHIGIHISHS